MNNMNLKIRDLIPRLESGLCDLIPHRAFTLIADIAQKNFSDEERLEIVEELTNAADLLLRQKSRYRLLGSLRENEADNLLVYLGIDFQKGKARSTLGKIAVNPSEEQLDGMLAWFGEERPLTLETEPESEVIAFKEDVNPSYALYWYQRNALSEISDYFKRGAPRVMLHMPTGSGKTRTAMAFVSQYLRQHVDGLVVWLADTYELCEQARKEFRRTWTWLGDRELPLYTITGEVNDVDYRQIEKGFVVITLQTAAAALRREEKERKETLTKLAILKPLVIFDEAHKAMAPKYKQVLDRLCIMDGSHALGLSATPGRTTEGSEENIALSQLFGGAKVMLKVEGFPSAISYLQQMGYLARPIFKSVNSQFDFSIFKGISKRGDTASISRARLQEIENIIAEDPERTLLIYQEAVRLIKDGHKRILLFAASVSQAHRMAYALNFFGNPSRSDICCEARAISADVISNSKRRSIIDWFIQPTNVDKTPKILCNYGILTTGFDAPETSAVLIARPTNSLVLYSQMIGRGLRGPKSGGTHVCEVITIVDKNLPAFWDIQAAFTNWESDWEADFL